MNPNTAMLDAIYQNITMAMSALDTLLPKANGTAIHSEIKREQAGYSHLLGKTITMMEGYGSVPQEVGFLSKAGAEMGIQFSTMLNHTPQHLAGMLIDGSDMGITDLRRLLKEYCYCDRPVVNLGQELLSFEEQNMLSLGAFRGN